jgi:hypothetical protein
MSDTSVADGGDPKDMRLSFRVASAVHDVARWILLAALMAGAAAAVAAALFGLEVSGYWDASRQQTQTKVATLELQNFAMKTELGKASREAARSSELLANSHQRITALALDAAEAKKSAAAANERAADSENKAAEARRELERHKAPRALSREQQSQLTERLRRFEKTPFEFSVAPASEAIALMGQLALALTESGWEWNVSSPLVFNKAGPSDGEVDVASGVQIQVDERKKQQWERPAIELREALKAAGIEVTAEVVRAADNEPSAIHIQIGHKS